jgi:hypothetical protein
VNTGLNANKAELSISVLAEFLQMLADGDSLLDQVIKVLGDLGSEASLLEDAENLGTSDGFNLGDTVGITESNTNLGGGSTLTCELDDLLNEVVGGDLNP